MRRYTELLAALALSTGMALHAQTNEMVIQTKKLGAEIQPTMYGLFFEDINYSADGGLYAEMVQNRSFEFDPIDNKSYNSFTAWEKSDGIGWRVCTDEPLNEENTHYLDIKGNAGEYIRNLGFNTGI